MSLLSNLRKHRLSEYKAFYQVLLISLLMIYSYWLIGQIVIVLIVLIPFMLVLDVQELTTCTAAVGCIGGLIVIFFYYWWFKPEYQWKPRNTLLSFKLASPILLYWFVLHVIIYTIAAGHLTFGLKGVTIYSILLMLQAGICEEVAFREIGISYMKRQLKDDKMNLPIILITSFVFGISHLLNTLLYGNFSIRIFQSLCAFLFAVFLGSIFLRTGNIWICILTHSIQDLLAVFFTARLREEDFPIYIYIGMIIGLLLLAAWGLFLIRKKKHPEIKELWNDKWQVTDTNQSMW